MSLSRLVQRRTGALGAFSIAALLCTALALPQDRPPSGERKPVGGADTQAPAQHANLPSAQEVLKKYVEATGGEEAYKKFTSQHLVGKFSMPAMGMEGTFELFKKGSDKMLAVINLPGMGEIRNGLNGKTGWRTDPMQGPRLVQGEELNTVLRDSDLQAPIRPEQHYSDMTVQGVEEVNGEQAYHVVLTPKTSGRPINVWYSVDSGLMLKSAASQETEMGVVEFESVVSDYKEAEGDVKIKLPHKITTAGGGVEYVITLDKVEVNAQIPDDRFELPPDVKQLLEQQPAEKQQM